MRITVQINLNIQRFKSHEKEWSAANNLRRSVLPWFFSGVSLRELAYVDPLACVGIAIQLVEIKLDGAAGAADSGEDGMETLKADVEIHGDIRVDPKGTDAADGMPHKL